MTLRRRPSPRLAEPTDHSDLERELAVRVREALVDKSTPAPLPPRLRQRMDALLDGMETRHSG